MNRCSISEHFTQQCSSTEIDLAVKFINKNSILKRILVWLFAAVAANNKKQQHLTLPWSYFEFIKRNGILDTIRELHVSYEKHCKLRNAISHMLQIKLNQM